jgi:hypothetical protein
MPPSRNPLIARLTLDWHGRPLVIGQWLRSSGGRTAYEIVGVRQIRQRDPDAGDRFALDVVKHPIATIPAGADVRLFRWYSRDPKPRHHLTDRS